MDRSLIKSMMPSLVAGHVPRNVRSFKYRVFDDQPLSWKGCHGGALLTHFL